MLTDFLAFDDYPADELEKILRRASVLAECWHKRSLPQSLQGIRIALIVDEAGWRNPAAFELGIASMGGVCVRAPVSLGGMEKVSDLAGYLDNWFDIIVARTPDLARLRDLADAAEAPVINARTRSNHPCETLGDLAFALHETGRLNGLRICVVAPDDNILGSWAEAASALPIEVVQVFPRTWHASRFAAIPRFSVTADLAALAGSDIVVTDCWPRDAPRAELLPYQVTAAILERYTPQSLFLPCPPVTRGQEVSHDAMNAPQCRVIKAKDFLLHAQNALLEAVAAPLHRMAG